MLWEGGNADEVRLAKEGRGCGLEEKEGIAGGVSDVQSPAEWFEVRSREEEVGES